MTPQPNRPLTAEDVGLLKRGDVLRLETDYERGFPTHAGGITTVEDVDLEGDTITVRTHDGLLEYFYPCTMEELFVFVERPVATLPAAAEAQIAALREVVEKAAAYIEALGDNIERNDVDLHLDTVERPASFAQSLRAALPQGER